MDLSSIVMNSLVVVLDFGGASIETVNRVSAISVLVLYLKLLYFLRVFFATAYLVRMIVEIIKDMKYFVGVLFLATIAFANAFYILGGNSEEDNFAGDNFVDALVFSYKLGLGDFITDGFGTRDEEVIWIFFFLESLIVLTVLLNLVIAIMGDTFDRVQETQENSMYKELASMIRENEFILSRVRKFRKAKYIIIIEPEKSEGGKIITWEGKLNQVRHLIEKSSEEIIDRIEKLHKDFKKMNLEGLNSKLKEKENKFREMLEPMNDKLDQINRM